VERPRQAIQKVAGETSPTQADICISALSASVPVHGVEGTLIGGHRLSISLVNY